MAIPRRVEHAGNWNVVHPLSGEVEAAESSEELALAVVTA